MNHNLIQMNRYCNDLHDDERIIFCKIDYIIQEFERLKNINRNFVLIIANGDITFNDYLFQFCPQNVKHIFATNTTCDNDRVTPIPIGVEMQSECKKTGHGGINKEIFDKLPYLLGETEVYPIKNEEKIYCNFNIQTNISFRSIVKEICISQPHMFFEFGISYKEFVNKVKSHIATISPRGNGIECIRTYEVLYLNSIPIVVGDKNEYNSIYKKIYKNLPIVFIDDLQKLKDYHFLNNEINKVKNNSRETLDYEYWRDMIIKKTNSIL